LPPVAKLGRWLPKGLRDGSPFPAKESKSLPVASPHCPGAVADPAGPGPLAERNKVPSRKKNKSLDVDRNRMYDSLWKKKAMPDKPLNNEEWILKQDRLLSKATGLPENLTPEKRLESRELVMQDVICCLVGRNDALTRSPIARKHVDAQLAPFFVYWQHMNDILPRPPAMKKI